MVKTANRWEEYTETLYEVEGLDGSKVLQREEEVREENVGCSILREKFEIALRRLKDNKATGIDNLRRHS